MSADTNQSRRSSDMSAGSQIGRFLDEYLYKRLVAEKGLASAERIDDTDDQLAGIDVKLIDKKGRVYRVDEKAQLYYLNQDLPTFAFEIQYLRGKEERLGWLCNQELLTDFYLLIWPFATTDKPKGIRWDQFTRADCLLVKKKSLLAELSGRGLTTEKMLEDARRIRADRQVGKVPILNKGKASISKEMYYFASDPQKYAESPINIVIRKPLLKKIAARHYIVTPEGVSS